MSGALCLLTLAAPTAGAHPLGNFSLNHYLGLTVHADGIEVLAVTDAAEIPTLQEQPKVDRNGDGTLDDAERTAWASEQCDRSARDLRVTTDRATAALTWRTASARFQYEDGSAGLRTSRLECQLRAELRLPADGTTVHVAGGSDPGRVGWNEITVRGDGAAVQDADVPSSSVSKELRDYPRDLLDSPSGVTHARFRALPGGSSAPAQGATVTAQGSGPTAWLSRLDARLTEIGAAQRLTVPLGLLAVLLSIVLGAGHALLPGHGKTVMAAYLAGRRGSTRDAVTVGATVTATHTAGVLVIGLCLTAFSSLAGDALLGWLGVLSGALVAAVGAGLLRDALRRSRSGARRARSADRSPAHAHHPHSHEEAPDVEPRRELAHVFAARAPIEHHEHQEQHEHPHPHTHAHAAHTHAPAAHAHDHDHSHGHDHGHDHGHGHGHSHDHDHNHDHSHDHPHDHGHRHGLFGGGHHHHHDPAAPGRRTLVGLGIAGGLVPSPSALVVLLGAVALGRTLFGAALVLAYGLGMAATLTAVGLLLVRLGDRLTSAANGPVVGALRRIAPYSALLTALLILTVGVGLVVRSFPSTL
ncbi:high frequency lysogenization protein HflD [Kitasatospora purpeofusca]|uniref:high frequency lysogenization protein HflD n=1 Tax=Kitasatospora purpeofusca TaxID=67352 RepID=UPI0036A72F9C